MSSLLAEIARKKKELQQLGVTDEKQKFVRRRDIEKRMEERYLEAQNGKKAAQNSHDDDDEDSNAAAKDYNEDDDLDNEDLPDIPMTEVRKRLRAMGQPVLMFGEDEIHVRRRLRNCEIQSMDQILERQRNEMQDALHNVDATAVNDILRGKTGLQEDTGPKYTWEEMQALGKRLGKESDATDMKLIRRFFKFLLELWGKDLNDRPIEIRQSSQGKRASAIYYTTAQNMKPLFKKLKKKDLPDDILFNLREIALSIMKREYIQANDAYLRMSIGNAPWPIGVTNVGIHSRTGREKISAHNIAHVLNDEMQRKYIQGLKRLMTFAQKRYPNVPSKCLEFQGMEDTLYPVSNDLKMREVEEEQTAWLEAGHGADRTVRTDVAATEK
ncbi:hypothetical protein PTSG_06732 [Salpingoeca rosetta]|uniref:Pre-mRNA-splicing factor 18 n=1 Tax=Salpingoeca rosetta (strain ATCC 50818 / BSB-021) TaxID=946362 RepID=F2UEM6_SALR5|nr:uncharacterized protein PTSG_06732 [Salpingoeca rosetta]EGD75076.1 hypothetical protein PTSG_06732 [Salpingoeca rosetta]|eukprot:XP_004992129.1 hypothetical protein PTSG_06732 [Salpingoeca rosetta]